MPALNPRRIAAILGAAGAVAGGTTVAIKETETTSHGVRMAEVPAIYAAMNASQTALIRAAYRYGVNSRTVYVWGGTSPLGFDCSGFTWYVYHQALGISLPRVAGAQYWDTRGKRVPLRYERPGDLVFFAGAYGTMHYPGHTGIYIGKGRYMEYYRSGYRSRITYLSDRTRGYIGAHRWYVPARVPASILNRTVNIAKRFHVKIIYSHKEKKWKRWAIDYVPRSRALYKWARKYLPVAEQLPHRTRVWIAAR